MGEIEIHFSRDISPRMIWRVFFFLFFASLKNNVSITKTEKLGLTLFWEKKRLHYALYGRCARASYFQENWNLIALTRDDKCHDVRSLRYSAKTRTNPRELRNNSTKDRTRVLCANVYYSRSGSSTAGNVKRSSLRRKNNDGGGSFSFRALTLTGEKSTSL